MVVAVIMEEAYCYGHYCRDPRPQRAAAGWTAENPIRFSFQLRPIDFVLIRQLVILSIPFQDDI